MCVGTQAWGVFVCRCVCERKIESMGLQKGNSLSWGEGLCVCVHTRGVRVCVCDRVNGAAERQLSWGEGLQATPVSLLPTLNKQTRATGQQDSDLGALPGTALAPVSRGLTCSAAHSRAHTPAPPSRCRTWGWWSTWKSTCRRRSGHTPGSGAVTQGGSGRPGQPLFTTTTCPAPPAAGSARLGLPGWGGQKVSLGGHKGSGGTGHTHKLSIIASTLRKSSQINKKSSQKNT